MYVCIFMCVCVCARARVRWCACSCRYRDLAIHVLFEGSNNLNIIGEVQMHVRDFWCLKNHMHKLYKIKRAETPDAV